MPSLLPGYEYDIFISYRQKDNNTGWVTEFVKALQMEIDSSFKESISLYFDSDPHQGLHETHDVDRSLEEKVKCLIFIPIVSQTYCDPNCFAWNQELLPFLEFAQSNKPGMDIKLPNGNVAKRVLPVRIHEIDKEDQQQYEKVTGGVLRPIDFIYKEAGVNRPLKPDDDRTLNLENTDYPNQINKVANAIKDLIQAIRAGHSFGGEAIESTTENRPEIASSPGTKKIRPGYLVGVILLLSIIVLGWWLFGGSSSTDDQGGYELDKARVAILPFENKTNNEELDILGTMIADWIIQGLMSFEKFKVVNFATTQDHLSLANGDNLDSFAGKTGAEKIIRGTYYITGEEVTVQSQLINVGTGEVELALPPVKGQQDDLESLVVEIRQKVLTLFVGDSDQGFNLYRQNPPKLEAYETFNEAITYFGTNYDKFRELSNKAISLDSTFIMPYLQIATSYNNQGMYNNADSVFKYVEAMNIKVSVMDKLWTEVTRAIIYGSGEDQYNAQKKIFDKDPSAFFNNYNTGLMALGINKPQLAAEHFSQVDPQNIKYNVPVNRWWNESYATSLIRLGKYEDAKNILDFIPKHIRSVSTYNQYALIAILSGNDDQIDSILDQLKEDFDDDQLNMARVHIARYYLTSGNEIKYMEWIKMALESSNDFSNPKSLAYAHLVGGNFEEVIKIYNSLENLTSFDKSKLGFSHAKLGNTDKAQEIIQDLESQTGEFMNENIYYYLACIYSGLGEQEKSVENLKVGINEGDIFDTDRLGFAIEFIDMKGYEPFEKIVRGDIDHNY